MASNRFDGFVTLNDYHRSAVDYTAAHDPQTSVGSYSIFAGSIGVQTADERRDFVPDSRGLAGRF